MSLTSKQALINTTVVGVPVADSATGGGVVTLLGLEQMVFMGLTYGAWFQIVMFIGMVIVIVLNLKKVLVEIVVPVFSKIKSWVSTKNNSGATNSGSASNSPKKNRL